MKGCSESERVPKESVDESAGAFPLEVRVVELVVLVELVEIVGEHFGRLVVVHVDVRVVRGLALIVVGVRAHHNWQHIVAMQLNKVKLN